MDTGENRPVTEMESATEITYDAAFGTILRISKGFREASKQILSIYFSLQL
jgi:hypothetical protein